MVIEARAPLEKMFGYSTAVRSLSQGRASYSMEPLEYAAAPDSLLESLAGEPDRREDRRRPADRDRRRDARVHVDPPKAALIWRKSARAA